MLQLFSLALMAAAFTSCQSLADRPPLASADPLDGAGPGEVRTFSSDPSRVIEQSFHEQHYREVQGNQESIPLRTTAGASTSVDW
jgi:hypothetical protein